MGIREKTENKVFAYIEKHGMILPGESVVAGVSGGADSVCLLTVLLAYRERVPFALGAAHVNHGIRSDAGEDARYVEELCARAGIPFFLTETDVRRMALEERCSEEDAGRRARYRALGDAVRRMGGGKAAVAHNSNDSAETMLFQLFRGSGLKGISGIAPVRQDGGVGVIRPILCLERREVEEYLRERDIPWRTDSTNSSDDYSRNRIRHHILPCAEREVEGAIGHMGRTAALLRETEDYLEEQTEAALERCLVQSERDAILRVQGSRGAHGAEIPGGCNGLEGKRREPGCAIHVAAFLEFHEAIRKRMLFTVMKRLSPTGKDISSVHVHDVLSLFVKEGNRTIVLPFGIVARRRYGQVLLERAGAVGTPGAALASHPSSQAIAPVPPVVLPLGEHLFQTPYTCGLGDGGKLEFSAFFVKKGQELPQNRCTKWLDYDKMEECLTIRSRERGDFLTIARGDGNVAHKSLKEYMIGEKIPRELRDRVPVVAMGSHVLWLVGWRISEHFKVDRDTKRILQVKLIRVREDSETEEKDVGAH